MKPVFIPMNFCLISFVVLLNLQLVVDWMLVKHGLKPSSVVLKCRNVLFFSYI